MGSSVRFTQLNRLQMTLVVATAVLMIAGAALLVIAFRTPAKKTPPKSPARTAIIQIEKTGFVPSSLHIMSGTKVVWVNKDAAPHQIAADPYPTHTSLQALFTPKALGQNETYSFVFTKQRTVNYHDELNPTWEGSIVIQ